MSDINELRRLAQMAHFGHMPLEISGSEVLELLDRLEAAETAWKEADKACRDLTEKVIPNLRESLEAAEKENALRERVIDALGSELNAVAKERDILRAKVDAMERQEPVAWARKLAMDLPSFGCVTDLKYRPSNMPESAYMPLYAIPCVQPESSVNEGVRKVTLGFRWESEAQHHIPTIEIEFDPVSPDSPNDARGWQDRDRLAAMLSPEARS